MPRPTGSARRQVIAAQANAGRHGSRRRAQLEATLREILARFTDLGGQHTATATSNDIDRWRAALGNDKEN
ncbi:hypothetical protein [Streptomyces achromogenes]|uniref:hypothetical protein n=1 Tax=Streptomyces achromogenes TaxID=67255 RepID=UPI00367E81B1